MRKIISILIFSIPAFSYSQVSKTASLPGQGNISGFVYNVDTNTPLPNANIILLNNNISTISNKDGKFYIANIAEGVYTLRVSYIGYQSFQKKIVLKKNQAVNIEVHLKDSVFVGKEVEITATKEKKYLDQPSRISIISAKNIEMSPVQNINEMIDYIPGASMSNTFGIFSSKTIVTLRGLPSNDQSRTLVLLDGVPLNISDEGSVNWNMINKNNIESIDVIKGPGPAKYGSGAMGGVINLISKKPSKKIEGNILMDYGTYNTLGTNMSLAGSTKKDSSSLNNFYWLLSGFGRKSDGYITELDQYKTVEDTILVPTFLKELNTSAKAGYVFKKNQNVELQLNYFDDMRGNGVKVFDNYGAYSTHRTNSGILKYSGNFRDLKWNSDIFLLREHYIRVYEYMKEGAYTLYGADAIRNDMGGNFDLSYSKFSFQNITAGLNYKLGSVDGADTYYTSTDIISNAAKMQTSVIFLQDEINLLNKKIQINAGIRYDFAKYYDGMFAIDYPSYSLEFYKNFDNKTLQAKQWNALCPRFAAQYRFSETKRVYLSVAKGFRAPILDDMSRTGQQNGSIKIANPELTPELIITYETGADMNLAKNLSANISVYYSIGKDFMYSTSTGDSVNMGYKISPIFEKKNIGKVEIYGVETELKYELGKNFSVFGNYSYTHAQIKKDLITNQNVDADLTGKYLTDIPNHKASTGFTWENKIVNASIMFKYIGPIWINDLNVVDENYLNIAKYPDYSIINMRLERKIIKNLSASLSVENIFDKIYITSNAQKCPGRFITVSVKYKFN